MKAKHGIPGPHLEQKQEQEQEQEKDSCSCFCSCSCSDANPRNNFGRASIIGTRSRRKRCLIGGLMGRISSHLNFGDVSPSRNWPDAVSGGGQFRRSRGNRKVLGVKIQHELSSAVRSGTQRSGQTAALARTILITGKEGTLSRFVNLSCRQEIVECNVMLPNRTVA